MHNLFFYYFFQKSLFTENYILIAAINLTTQGPLYTCLVILYVYFLKGFNKFFCIGRQTKAQSSSFYVKLTHHRDSKDTELNFEIKQKSMGSTHSVKFVSGFALKDINPGAAHSAFSFMTYMKFSCPFF